MKSSSWCYDPWYRIYSEGLIQVNKKNSPKNTSLNRKIIDPELLKVGGEMGLSWRILPGICQGKFQGHTDIRVIKRLDNKTIRMDLLCTFKIFFP